MNKSPRVMKNKYLSQIKNLKNKVNILEDNCKGIAYRLDEILNQFSTNEMIKLLIDREEYNQEDEEEHNKIIKYRDQLIKKLKEAEIISDKLRNN